MRRLAAGDRQAAADVTISGKPLDGLGDLIAELSVEFGLAKAREHNETAVIVGTENGVNWELVDRDEMEAYPLAHSHPAKGRDLLRRPRRFPGPPRFADPRRNGESSGSDDGFSLTRLFDQTPEVQALVLPSMSDFWLGDHTVYTPYRLTTGPEPSVERVSVKPSPRDLVVFTIESHGSVPDDLNRDPIGVGGTIAAARLHTVRHPEPVCFRNGH